MNEIFKKRIKQSIIDNGLSDTLQVTDIFLDDALNIIGKDYIRQNLHKLMIDLKNYVLADLGWHGGVVINDLYGWDEGIDFMQNTDRLAIIDYVSLGGIEYTWYDVDMEENMGYMSMSWSDEKLLERPEVMIELFNFLCDFYRQRFEGGREDDRFMMEETNLRDKIKRILREENTTLYQLKLKNLQESNKKESLVNKIKQWIKDDGIIKAATRLGLTVTEIVKIFNLPINSEIANVLLIDNLSNNNLSKKYREFTLDVDEFNGLVYWESKIKTGHFLPFISEEISVMATPFWDGVGYTPVEISSFTLFNNETSKVIITIDGEGDYYKEIKSYSMFENIEDLFSWYDNVYLPNVYDIIMNKLLPEIHQTTDDELDKKEGY